MHGFIPNMALSWKYKIISRMIPFDIAYQKVLKYHQEYGSEHVPLEKAMGRILDEDVFADRDFPPFDRATKDGIAINFSGLDATKELKIQGVVAAGTPHIRLENITSCLEIMTGAVLPMNTDTVVMYEDIEILNGMAILKKLPKKGGDIHYQGSDMKHGDLILSRNTRISSAEIGLLAAVGKSMVLVKKLPKITLVSTGNELVDINDIPLPFQIRKSNIYSLYASLSQESIIPDRLHINDDKLAIKEALSNALHHNDVLLLSGGVSKGKFDFIPEVFSELGVERIFHGVMQQPGKPFWFGIHKISNTVIFSFPGNPVSTFVNYHIYFKDWLYTSLDVPISKIAVILSEEIQVSCTLTKFFKVKISLDEGRLLASLCQDNGSGDLVSLTAADGFIRLAPRMENYKKGDVVPFIPTRTLV